MRAKVLILETLKLLAKGVRSVKNALSFFYRLTLKPILKLCYLFFWSPVTIIFRSLSKLVLLPTNLPLLLFYNTTVSDFSKVNLHLTVITITLCIQYFITLMIAGTFIGLYCGFALGFLHRWIRIPDKHVEILKGVSRWIFPATAQVGDEMPFKQHAWQHAPYPTPSVASTAMSGTQQPRRTSRASVGSVSNAVAKLPHDFFQPKTPRTPMGVNGKTQFDPSKLSPLSVDKDDETASNSSNMWDLTDDLPETLRTELTARINSLPRPFTSGADQSNYTKLRELKNKASSIDRY